MSTSTSPLFSHPEIWCLPKRGRFTAAEALAEWINFLPDLMARWDGWKGAPEAEQIDRCARHAFEQSEADAAKLLPHLDAVEDSEQLHELQSLRDRVREYIASPATFAPPASASEAEQIEFYVADLRASWRRQIELADRMIRDAGPLPLTAEQTLIAIDGWKCMAHTIVKASERSCLELIDIETLEALIAAADRLRALWDDEQPQEGVG